MARKRVPTVCTHCHGPSRSGRVCRSCKKWGSVFSGEERQELSAWHWGELPLSPGIRDVDVIAVMALVDMHVAVHRKK